MLEKFLFRHESLSSRPSLAFLFKIPLFLNWRLHKSYANEHKGTEDNERLEF